MPWPERVPLNPPGTGNNTTEIKALFQQQLMVPKKVGKLMNLIWLSKSMKLTSNWTQRSGICNWGTELKIPTSQPPLLLDLTILHLIRNKLHQILRGIIYPVHWRSIEAVWPHPQLSVLLNTFQWTQRRQVISENLSDKKHCIIIL